MGHRLSKIYTRTGDDGTTGLADGSRVAKDSPRIAALGDLDELNSVVGLLLTEELPEDIRLLLTGVQHDLFDLGGEMAIPGAPSDPIQIIDVRDLGEWLVRLCELKAFGAYNACGQPVYFVQERWYNEVYVPRHRSGRVVYREDDRGHYRDDDRGRGRGHGKNKHRD